MLHSTSFDRRSLNDELPVLQGGLYWLLSEQASDAAHLSRQLLSGPATRRKAVMVGAAGQSFDLGADAALAEVTLFELPLQHAPAALRRLPSELRRAGAAAGGLILLLLPASIWLESSAIDLQRWCERMRRWLREQRCTLFLLSTGPASELHRKLLPLHEQLTGLAQLYRSDGAIRCHLHYWRSGQGVRANQEFELESGENGLMIVADDQSQDASVAADDQRLYLAEQTVLEGAPALSDHWRLFESRAAVLEQAHLARAASILLTISDNDEVEPLARQVHQLRQQRGNALKIVVREMSPCLRYRDERLLTASGANLIAPYGTQLSGFLSLLDSVQGQRWQRRSTTDFSAKLDRQRPPQHSGLLDPADFLALVEQVFDQAKGELSHLLLRLRPHPRLSMEQVLSQIHLRRLGDVICVVDDSLYLFLFASRLDGLESALSNICRLPWRQLFDECLHLEGPAALPRQDFLEAEPGSAGRYRLAAPASAANDDERLPLLPQRMTLPGATTSP